MNPKIREVLTEIEEFGRKNDTAEAEHSRRMLNLDPETAKLLSILLQSSRAKSVLEIGTSSGYSTIWLAASIRNHGGHVVSIDRSAEKHALAKKKLAKSRRFGLCLVTYRRRDYSDERTTGDMGRGVF